MRIRAIWGVVALAPLMIVGCATESAQSPPPVVIQPGQRVVVESPQSPTVMPSSQVIQADDIVANEVRAQTIYANKIRAPEVQGAIHQTGQVRIDGSVPDLKAPTITASVIYADTIQAHRVIADNIFVRDLDRR